MEGIMTMGLHTLLFSHDADATRAFFRDVIELESVDAGGGWLIFALPPAELAVHPTDGETHAELYLMCEDLDKTMAKFRSKGVEFIKPVSEQSWGRLTDIRIPGDIELGLYQPRHPTALDVGKRRQS
jgi:predicted enzyme related to lactoylglutathione lyase